jgi:hypothetical protein
VLAMSFTGGGVMLTQPTSPNATPAAGSQPRRRKRFLLGWGVSLLAVLSAAVLLASVVERVRDTADRAT